MSSRGRSEDLDNTLDSRKVARTQVEAVKTGKPAMQGQRESRSKGMLD